MSKLAWAVPAIHIPVILLAGVLTPAYVTATGAISKLGSTRSPYHALVNVWALMVPGLLLTLSVIALVRRQPAPMPPRAGLVTVGAAGLAVIGCGWISLPSTMHLAMSLPADLLAATGLFLLGPWAARAFRSRGWVVSAFAVGTILIVDAISWGLDLQGGGRIHGYLGLQQRLGVFGAFVWWAAFVTRLERETCRTRDAVVAQRGAEGS